MIRNKIDRNLRRILSPALQEYGFKNINSRNYYALQKECIWVFHLNHVGKYDSELSGWSAQSLNGIVGIYFDFIPPPRDAVGRIEEFSDHDDCQLQMELCSQGVQTNNLSFNREKDPIWWFHSDGTNMEDVIYDIRNTFISNGLPWLKKYSNIECTFKKIEGEMNSYHKFYKAKFFAKYLNQWDKYEKYNRLFKIEATKFGE